MERLCHSLFVEILAEKSDYVLPYLGGFKLLQTKLSVCCVWLNQYCVNG